jgi:hypothetical protein
MLATQDQPATAYLLGVQAHAHSLTHLIIHVALSEDVLHHAPVEGALSHVLQGQGATGAHRRH